MKAKMTVVNPKNTVVTLEMTMTIKEWSELRALLKSDTWPASDFSRLLERAIWKAEVEINVSDEEVSS